MKSKRAKWIKLCGLLQEDMHETLTLGYKYERLRVKLIQEEPGHYGPAGVVKQMRFIEEQKERLWRPHRALVGPCVKCDGTREPGRMLGGFGFGCIRCHDFEIWGKGETPGDPRLN